MGFGGSQTTFRIGSLRSHAKLGNSNPRRQWDLQLPALQQTCLPPKKKNALPSEKGQEKQPGSSASRRRPFTTPCDLAAPKTRGPGLPFSGAEGPCKKRQTKLRNLFEGNMNLRASCWYPAAEEDPGASRDTPFGPEASPCSVHESERNIQAQTGPARIPTCPHFSPQGQHPGSVHPALCIATGPFLCGATWLRPLAMELRGISGSGFWVNHILQSNSQDEVRG